MKIGDTIGLPTTPIVVGPVGAAAAPTLRTAGCAPISLKTFAPISSFLSAIDTVAGNFAIAATRSSITARNSVTPLPTAVNGNLQPRQGPPPSSHILDTI